MANLEIVCPYCNKQKLQVQYEDKKEKRIKKVKGGDWDSILTQVDESHWTDNPEHGISVKCKCGGQSILTGIFHGPNSVQIKTDVQENQLLGGFCQKCRKAFVATTYTCPICGEKI